MNETCGCLCHEIDPNDNNNVIFQGKKWNCLCALRESIYLLAKIKESLSKSEKELERLQQVDQNYKRLISNVEELLCPYCFKRVESNWVFADGGVCCTMCAADKFPNFF